MSRFQYYKMYFLSYLNYIPTIKWLIRTRGLRAAYNFVYVKLFVSEGEGTWGVFNVYLFKPILKRIHRMQWLCKYPNSIEIEITHKCNKKCVVCEHTSPNWKEPNRDTTFEEFKSIVDQFKNLKWVNLTGEGDSFLNKDYLKMIKYLKDRNIPVYLVDSFDLITPEIGRQLVDMGVDGIYVSFDGATKETYEKMKPGCNYERTINNIRELIKYKQQLKSPVPDISFRYIITTMNMHEIERMPEMVEKIANPDYTFIPISIPNTGMSPRPSLEFVGLLKFPGVEQYMVDKLPDEIVDKTIKEGMQRGIVVSFSHPGEMRIARQNCTAWTEPYIMMGGYVLSCCALLQTCDRDRLRRLAYGNVYERPFSEIWRSTRYVECRETLQLGNKPELCKGCRVYDVYDD